MFQLASYGLSLNGGWHSEHKLSGTMTSDDHRAYDTFEAGYSLPMMWRAAGMSCSGKHGSVFSAMAKHVHRKRRGVGHSREGKKVAGNERRAPFGRS